MDTEQVQNEAVSVLWWTNDVIGLRHSVLLYWDIQWRAMNACKLSQQHVFPSYMVWTGHHHEYDIAILSINVFSDIILEEEPRLPSH